MTKARFGVDQQRFAVQRVLAHALDTLLRLLHPMIPFLTEEVWQLLAAVAPQRGVLKHDRAAESVCIAAWPEPDLSHQDSSIEEQFADFQAVLGAIREVRTKQNVPQKEAISFCVRCDSATATLLRTDAALLCSNDEGHRNGVWPKRSPARHVRECNTCRHGGAYGH